MGFRQGSISEAFQLSVALRLGLCLDFPKTRFLE